MIELFISVLRICRVILSA